MNAAKVAAPGPGERKKLGRLQVLIAVGLVMIRLNLGATLAVGPVELGILGRAVPNVLDCQVITL